MRPPLIPFAAQFPHPLLMPAVSVAYVGKYILDARRSSATMAGMAKFSRFLAAIMSDWLARMSGPLTVPFAVAAFLLPSVAARVLFAVLAVIAALITFYRVWGKEYDRAEAEKEKNEIAPEIEVQVSSIITKGSFGSGVTDLFAHLILTLREPNEVVVKDFSLTAQQGTEYFHAVALEDTCEWEVMKEKSDPEPGYFHIPCAPVAKHLKQRGDPVEGWIHFPLNNVRESWLLKSMLWVKVNSAHGTCLKEVQRRCAFPDPKTKGVMRKL